ncbi:hypothetical protein MMC25_002683 [Agyrium rufum]|nr:hypothetical protein [Agyrium rufum]
MSFHPKSVFFLVACAILPVWTAYHILLNHRVARRIGLPIVISPISELNPLWILCRTHLTPYLVRLPIGLGDFTRYSYLGWQWADKNGMHARFGDAFTIVSPEECQIIVADRKAAEILLARRKDFLKWPKLYDLLSVFGANVNTVDGEDWQRHRKITTPPFNERNRSLVWDESLGQAKEMLETWTSTATEGTNRIVEDTHSLSLHVLSAAGFGKSYSFHSAELNTPEEGHDLSLLTAMRTFLEHIFTSSFITLTGLPPSLLPKKMAAFGIALTDFRLYMKEMVARELRNFDEGDLHGQANLMSAMIRASKEAEKDMSHHHLSNTGSRRGLTIDEIYGNLFIYHIAGFETTAAALANSIANMIAHPQYQDWIGEEIDEVFGDSTDLQYEEAYPKLKKCLAVMHETLRLWAPLNGFHRWTGDEYQTLQVGKRELVVPPRTTVVVNNAALQVKEEFWGADALEWRPNHWIERPVSSPVFSSPSSLSLANEIFRHPVPEGVYTPWLAGPRVCPGKKFSQVELVAVLATLFRQHRAKPVLETGEENTQARTRITHLVEDSHMVLAIVMKHPERMRVQWKEKVEAGLKW